MSGFLDRPGRPDGAGGVGGLLWVTVNSGPVVGTHYCAYDGNGNVVGLVSSTTGTETARYEYGPFGEPLRVTGPAAGVNPFRFSTKRTDAMTDLVFYEYRAYGPAQGRWPNRDPIGENGGINLYGFVRNRPINAVDTDGRLEFPRFPTVPSFPWPDPFPRPRPPTLPPINWPRINLPENPIACANRIKNEVWDKFGWDEEGNPRPGHRAGDNSFHYGHCVAHCRIQRECLGGRCVSWAGGLGKEIWDEIRQHVYKEGVGYEGGDMDANREGRRRGRHMKHLSCEDACIGMEG